MVKKAAIFIFLILTIIVFVMGFMLLNKPSRPGLVTVGEKTIKVEILKTLADREKGLSGRPSLLEGTGMLFVFEKPDFYSFWMKDMNFPIDIIWIGKDYKIVDISANVSPSTFPKTFLPKDPAQFVLEVNAGWAGLNKISVGDNTKFSL